LNGNSENATNNSSDTSSSERSRRNFSRIIQSVGSILRVEVSPGSREVIGPVEDIVPALYLSHPSTFLFLASEPDHWGTRRLYGLSLPFRLLAPISLHPVLSFTLLETDSHLNRSSFGTSQDLVLSRSALKKRKLAPAKTKAWELGTQLRWLFDPIQ